MRRQYERSRREAMGTQGGVVHEGAGERQEATESSSSIFRLSVLRNT